MRQIITCLVQAFVICNTYTCSPQEPMKVIQDNSDDVRPRVLLKLIKAINSNFSKLKLSP